MTHTLGIDIGTFESKGVLVDGTGRIVATATRPHRMLVPRPGWAEHRAEEDWWGDFVHITRALLAESGVAATDIACVAASAIGPCMLPVDADGAPLMNGVLYGVDTRAAVEIEDLTTRIGADRIMQVCGNALTSQSVGPKILWLKNRQPELYARTAKVLTSTSYITWKLTGEYVIDHYTAANFSPLYDVNALAWTDALAPDILPLEKLPRLMWSTDIAGHVTAAAAAETGLAIGTPVTCGTIDAAAEAVSVGVQRPGEMMMMYGSTIFIIQVTSDPVRDARLWYAPWLWPGMHASMAGLATSGTLTHWFRDQFARDTSFGNLAAEAAASPKGAKGLICLPYFSGERTPIHDPLAKGAFFGLDLTHTRGDMFRAVLEGIASGTAHVLDTYRALGAFPDRILAVGGGTKNAVWMQATSDIGGAGQIVCEKTVGASYGNAFLAATAVGKALPDQIVEWNPVARTVRPETVAAYARQYPLFKRLYAQTRDIAHELGGA
ncbi:FGGY-family carbohydrate kinase [Rhodobacter sp. HX-7-19]|uniref:FGGY-family carbohydrate kinase n=1 Tax=Paragemmobacter kunshanensis TaxID=2583234 RepID=A0A6M1TUB0_9RHOB|nr:FGGY-family carbohydrate kinase [Rhodobacter kunshanensis]NGQ91710.1 FGGY-family carbohydrate kinase [Rhodobacter kunshanensis]